MLLVIVIAGLVERFKQRRQAKAKQADASAR
jgi:hypothetical protein